MSAYDGHLSRASRAVTEEEVQEMARQKAHELFNVCDIEHKGFITKRDMQRLQNELPLLPDQLEAVFDSLDDDGNGFLTLEEFTEGFGSYLGINFMGDSTVEGDETIENVYEGEDKQEEEKQFTDMMENIGAKSLFDDENTIKHLWMKIRRDEPEMVGNFEEFLYKISSDLKKTKVDFDTLENALKSKSSAHDEEVRKLYEEMEYQIKREKERILSEEQLKEKQIRETLERDLNEKDKQLQDLLNKHQEMERKLEQLNQVEAETKQENERLAKEKEELEDMLMKSQEGLEDSKMYIDQLRKQQKQEKQERARAAIKLTESIALERESLVKQLDTLKDVNKKLRDDKDEAEIRRDVTSISEVDDPQQILEAEASPSKPNRKELCKQGSILGDYFPRSPRKFESTAESIEESLIGESEKEHGLSDDDIEYDDELIGHDCDNFNNNNNKLLYGDSYDQIKPSYYGHDVSQSPSSKLEKLDQSAGSSDDLSEEDDSKGSKRSRLKSKRRKPTKKPGFHPISMHSKRTVTPPNGDGDSYEEEGDNIDMMVAPAFEDSLASNQFGEPLSIYFENLRESEKTKCVEVQTIAVQTIEEDIAKSNLEHCAKYVSVDSSTNTEIFESKEIEQGKPDLKGLIVTLDCATNTELLETNVDSVAKALTHCAVDMSTNTDDQEPHSYKQTMSTICSNHSSTLTNLVELEADKAEKTMTDFSTDRFNSAEIPAQFNPGRKVKNFKLLRNSRIHGNDSEECCIEMTNMASPSVSMSASKIKYDIRPVKPLIGPKADHIDFNDKDAEEIQGTRGQPVGADVETDEQGIESTVGLRQRIFKVVFVGDSGVGKSSFIHRFCNNHFNPTFSATIGVDFQVKSLIIGGQSIVLQLWDTAGQERFRSITKQYFRKADGVVIMYDVNSEATYTNVRNWMESVQEGVEEGTAILIIGNKTDMADSEADRVVKTKDGNKLSVEYDGIFFETSAKNGINIKESMEAMARILKEKEDKDIEKSLHLEDNTAKKKFCCG